MALLDQPIPNLFGGVSQQPALARFLNQLGAQDNCLADPVEGLRKRPPFEHIAKLIDGDLGVRPAVFDIDRDPDNQYMAVVYNGTVRVFSKADGAEMTVNNPSVPYLNTSTPHTSIRSLTVADYTFLVNREVSVGQGAATSAARPYEGLLFVRAANYGKTYKVTLKRKSDNAILGSSTYTTQDGSAPSHVDSIQTTTIASSLASGLGAASLPIQGGSVVYILLQEDFTIEVDDDQGGQALKAYKDTVQRFSDLPEKAAEGFLLKVVGDQSSSFDDYYVRFNGTVWEEAIKPEIKTDFDPDTLPVALIRQPNGTFNVETLPWVARAVGDDESNPFPSFTGQKINSMFYFRNRLGFLADENVILSKAGDYFNFFRTTVTALLPDDPIDTPASDASGESSPVSLLEHAVAFDKKLVIFARNAQFIMGADGALTPETATIDPVTAFSASALCRPVAAGRYVYFPFDRDGATGFREFYVDGAAQTEDAEEITSHVPTYIPSGIVALASSTIESVIVALPGDNARELYVWEYFWTGQDKMQSAWGRWLLDSGSAVLSFSFQGNVGYALVQRSDGYHMEKVRFRPRLTDTGLPYFTHLDHRVVNGQFTSEYDAINDETVITLPYAASADVVVATAYSATALHAPGIIVPVASKTGYTLRLAGNKTAWSLVIGIPYTKSFTLTRPYVQSQSGSGTIANTEAVVKVRDYSLDFTSTGYFKAIFTPKYRDPIVKEFSGRLLGATALNIPPLEEGTFRIKTPTRNTYWSLTIENASIFPSSFLAASWRGLVESKSQRV